MAPEHFDLTDLPYSAVYDRDGTILQISDALADLLGYQPAELVGTSGWQLTDEANGERRARVHDTLDTIGALKDTSTLLRRNGTRIRFSYVAQVLSDGRVVSTGEPVPPNGFLATANEARRVRGAAGHEVRRTRDAVDHAHHLVGWALELAGTPGRWLTTLEAVDYCHVSVSTLDRAVRTGELPRGGTRGRRLFHTAWLDRWLAGGGSQMVLALLLLLVLLGLACLCLDPDGCRWLRDLGLKLRHTHA